MNELSADYMKAADLDRRIKVSAQLAQKSLYDMCMGFKEMRDSGLYKELGFAEFNDYCCDNFEISDRQVYRYIQIVEKLPAELVTSMSRIGSTKLLKLTALDEEVRTEIVQTTDLEKTTVKELEAKIKVLTAEKEKAVRKYDTAREGFHSRCEMLEKKLSTAETIKANLSAKLGEAEEKIEELENRPVEVAVADNSEELDRLRTELNQKHETEMDAVKKDYEMKLANIQNQPAVPDVKEVFKAYLSSAVDSAKRLLDFIGRNPDSFYKDKARELFGEMLRKLEE